MKRIFILATVLAANLSITQPAFAQSEPTRRELISQRLELLKQQDRLDREIESVDTQLRTASCGGYAAKTVAITAGVIYMVTLLKPSRFARANAVAAGIDLDDVAPKIPGNIQNNAGLKRNLEEASATLGATENRGMIRRIAIVSGLVALTATAMTQYHVSCGDIPDFVDRLYGLRDDIKTEADQIVKRMGI